MKMKAVFLAVFSLAAAGLLCAADVYVKAGSSGKGTIDNPYGELWKAVERAERGDVIHVAAGTYYGKGGAGHFKIGIPNLTLAGGYSADFSSRDPFKNFTILERSRDFRGDWTGLPEGIIAGEEGADHGGLTVDGFVLNCTARNTYDAGGQKVVLRAPSYPGKAVQGSSKNFKIRNCIILSPIGEGIYWSWQGGENEVSNNFILNTFYSAIETRSAQPESVITIRNNTIAFVWFYPSKGGGMGIFVGRQGQTIIDSNVLAFLQTEGGEAGYAVSNTFGNEDTIMRNNVFFSTPGGYYKYMDYNKANLIVWKPGELDDLNDEDYCEDYMLLESGGNQEADPGLKPDKDYALLFANYVESTPGKLNMDAMNQWRQAMGLPLQGQSGTPRPILAPPYPMDKIVPNLVSSIPGVGVQVKGPFAVYSSEGPAANLSYRQVEFASLKKGAAKYTDGDAVEFKAGMGDNKTTYEIESVAPRSDYQCVQLLIPGSSGPSTRDIIYGYLLKGSPAHKDWEKLYAKKEKTYKDGITIKGQVYNFKNQSYPYPYGIVVTEVSGK
ncbi:MAG: right-handed parallel beta-helix repeat-containing protein [Spirochaetales bacterium]|nr:MAG: right-handed parallel beta-helix repeat-containing protein [Spirochaetales bacterium]